MLKRICAMFCCLCLICVTASGCASKKTETVPTDMEEFYNQFIETFSTGTYEDLAPLLHFEIEEYQEMTEEFYGNIYDPQLESWEKIQDNLWVANTYVKDDPEGEPMLANYFVGRFDGELRVMIGVFQVPSALSGGADLTRFIGPDELSPW